MSLYVEKCSLDAVAKFIHQMKADRKLLPFFVLDEMTPSTDEPGGKNLAAFQRNVFRVCGLVVVVMGTDSKITNLAFRDSRVSSVNRHHWMTIFPRFPPIQPMQLMDEEKQDTWDQMQTQYPVLEIIAEKSRGRFSRFFTESVVKYAANTESVSNLCDLLDEAFSEVHWRTIEGKNYMRKENGPAAQLKVISYSIAVESPGMKRRASDGGEDRFVKRRKLAVRSDYMHVHFANLIDEQPSDIHVSNGALYLDKDGWEPQCRFPTVEEDLLLYLAMLGGKKYSAYFGGNITHSVFDIFSTHVRGRFKLYEEMVAQMAFCASRRNGVRGIHFKDFLPCLLQEFQEETESKPMTVDGEEKTTQEILQGYSDFSEFLATTVPFLAPPNAQWPQYLLDTRDLDATLVISFAPRINRGEVYVYTRRASVKLLCSCANAIIRIKAWTWAR